MIMPTENRINADKGTPDEIVEKKVRVKAKNEPEMELTEGVGEKKDLSKPTGDADDALLGNK
jgi:hypothetical protein